MMQRPEMRASIDNFYFFMPQLVPFYFLNQVSFASNAPIVTFLILVCLTFLALVFFITRNYKMPGVKCPRCAEEGVEQ